MVWLSGRWHPGVGVTRITNEGQLEREISALRREMEVLLSKDMGRRTQAVAADECCPCDGSGMSNNSASQSSGKVNNSGLSTGSGAPHSSEAHNNTLCVPGTFNTAGGFGVDDHCTLSAAAASIPASAEPQLARNCTAAEDTCMFRAVAGREKMCLRPSDPFSHRFSVAPWHHLLFPLCYTCTVRWKPD